MDDIDKQNVEFDAMNTLALAWRNLQMTGVVDDDYPRMRHQYEGALQDFLMACQTNGRFAARSRFGTLNGGK